ncbi:hypothetical protein NI17_024060 (plasmid) [Thermobifida halotolerans]|uniref:Uncharacterized protein n=1 Tax=Thermobifida halotolerans TaxID=483545 RepID=A0A399FTW5_9ACTN|nr:hypothetical protein [Thermobifida halotolerans]UOE22289.1 hypothetical protein NI17_024060 [Thermobifida halotolerans]
MAALGLAAAATTSHVLDVAPLWGAAAGVAGAATSVAVGAHQQTTPSGQMLRIGRWAASGTWLTWCLATTPWDLNTLLALAVGAGISSGLTPLLAPRAPRASATGRGGGLVLRATSQLEREWETRLARITRRSGYQVTHTEHWDTGAGYTLTVELPSGMTRRALVPYLDALAADARLMEGCGVEAAPARYRGTVRLLVSTVNRMAHTIDYPADFAPRSILDPITLGEHRDSSPAQARWREHSALVAGQKGSGKTTLLNVATAEVGRCTDALCWHIDLTGGGLSRAWLDPWLRGETERPALDWAVCTPEDAAALVAAALNISTGRKASAFEKKMAADTSLLPIGADLPEIVTFVDEGKTLLAPTTKGVLGQIRKGLEQLQDIARDSAVNPVLSTLRATADTLSPGIKKQAVCRVAMAGSDDEEIAYLMGWKNLSVEDLAGPGTGFLSDGGPARPFRAYQLTPRRIAELARTIAQRRPELDRASQQHAGEAYARRYQRMRQTFGGMRETITLTPPQPAGDGGAGVARPRLRLVEASSDNWLDDPTDIEEVPATTSEPVPGPARPGADPTAWLLPGETPTTTDDVQGEDLLERAIAVLDTAGDDRMHSEDLATALGMTTEELAAALREHGVRPLPEAFKRGGQRCCGYARTDLHAATQRHSNVGA